MATHSGDTPIHRFFSFWGAIVTFVFFGVLALVGVAIESSLFKVTAENPDDVRRTALDQETLSAQAALVTAWKKNDDGTYEVPIEVALPKMVGKLPGPSKSNVPVPGTAAAEAAAAALVAPSTEDTEPEQN
jgi:hypothetical protein